MAVAHINQVDFNKLVEQKGILLVDFSADWCPPCKVMKPIFDNMSNEFDGVEFAAVDVDNEQSLSQQFSVQSIPTFVLLDNSTGESKVLKRWTGAQDPLTFRTEIEELTEDLVD